MVKLPIVEQLMSRVRKPAAPAHARPHVDRTHAGFDSAPVGIAFAGRDGHWLQMNARFPELVGYTRDELARITFHGLTHPEDARRETPLMKRLVSGDLSSYHIAKRVMEKKGSYRAVEVEVGLARDANGDPDFFIYVVAEPQLRSNTQEMPRDAERFYATLLNELKDVAVIRTNDKGLITGWNAGAERLLGYKRDEVLAKNRRMLYRDPDMWEGKSTRQLREVADAGSLEIDDWRVAKDGRHLWVRSVITPFRPDGTVKGYIEVMTVATGDASIDLRKAADTMRATSESRVAEMQRTLDTLRAELDKSQRTEESLREALSHIRTVAEETMNELKIMTGALRKELDRRKAAEAEVLRLGERLAELESRPAVVVAAPEPEPPAREELAAAPIAPPRSWTPLVDTTPAELLIAHGSDDRSGTLFLASGEREKEIFFDRGRIFSCASNEPSHFLTQRLIAAGYITEEQRQRALEIRQETHLALGRILLVLGAITEEQLIEVMLAKLEDEIAEVFDWKDARYAFVEGSIPSLQLVPLRVDVTPLVVKRLHARGRSEVVAPFELPLPSDDESLGGDWLLEAAPEWLSDLAADAASEPPPPSAAGDEPTLLIASAVGKSRKYHRPTCSVAPRIAEETRVMFINDDDAVRDGYERCRLCFR